MVTNLEVFGLNGALRGMRNPKNSWHLNDSTVNKIGPNDLKLATTLNKAGSEHRKFLRMIHAQFDLTLPRYVWSEFDTYKIGTVANSCSTMHKLFDKNHKIDKYDFAENVQDDEIIKIVINKLNEIREEYLAKPNNELLRYAKGILPESYLQKRTIDINYEQLINIYKQRRNHRLKEWRDLCDEILEFPFISHFLADLRNENE